MIKKSNTFPESFDILGFFIGLEGFGDRDRGTGVRVSGVRCQGSGISGTEGTVVAGLLPTSLFTDAETFLMNLRVVSDDYKIHPSGSTI